MSLGALDYFTLSLLLGGFVAVTAGSIVYFNDRKNKANIAWLMLNIVAAIWSFGYFSMISAETHQIAVYSNLFLHAAAILIPVFYLLFVLSLTNYLNVKTHRAVLIIGALSAFIFEILNPTALFIQEVKPKFIFNFAPDAGPLYVYFALHFFLLTLYAIFLLVKKISETRETNRTRFIAVLASSTAGFLGGGSVFFLTFNVGFPPYPIILFSLYPIIIAYAMLKYNLFNVRLVVMEVLVATIWSSVFIQIFLSDSWSDRVNGGIMLVVVVLFGIMLIRGVQKEVDIRDEAERLSKKLVLANKRLVQLEQQKSEFVSIASHQLRTPLTAIKGYASMAIEGSFGKLENVVLEPLNTIFAASQKLVALVEDLLTVSRIEQGRIKYDWAMVDIKGVMEDAIKDNKDDITERRLSVSVRTEKDGMQYLVWADRQRLKQVFNNIIDNAVKFTPKGFVRVLVSKDESRNWVRVAISDTGIGMDKKALEALFVDPQKRAQMADKGDRAAVVGIGIYIAQQIVKTHKGRIWADSDGVNRGSTFFVELPAYEKGKSEAATAQ